MQAIILAGGLGKRLMPLTQELPKPMIPVINRPLMEYSVNLLKENGISDIGITVMYLPQFIKNHFNDGKKFDVNIKYFEETNPLGTAGSVKLAQNFINDTFVVLSGDALTNININKIYKYHKTIGADVTIVLSKQENPIEYGVVLTDDDGKITSFVEKPQWENVVSNKVNTGIYLIEKHVLDKIPENTQFDFSKDLFPLLLKENYKLYGYLTEDYWCDLGNSDAYLNANIDILNGKVFDKKHENTLEENVILSENTKLVPPVYIGKNSIISGKSTIGPNVVIGENSILENVSIKNSVLWNKCVITDCEMDGEVIGENTRIDKAVFNGKNTIGSNVVIKKNVLLKNGAKVFNNVSIMPESIISGEIKHSNFTKNALFEDGIIQGIWNHQIKTEHLLGIASSFKDNKVFVASNKTQTGIAIANLLASFYSLCGSNVYIFNSYIGSARFFSSVNKMQGVYIFDDNEFLNIHLIDNKGLNLPYVKEKNIDFNLVDYALNKGKIIRLNSVDNDFEYFLNASFPFTRENIEVYSNYSLKLHNVINKDGEFKSLSGLSKAAVIAKNNTVTDIYYDNQRISSVNFMKLKLDIAKIIGAKEVFMPPYVTEEIINEANNSNIKIINIQQHLGNSMHQVDNFNNTAILLEYVPHFFAEALLYYLQKQNIDNSDTSIISRYDFNINPTKSLEAIFNLNKNKTNNHITADYRGGFITIVPGNNGYSFTAYGRFAREEYAPDILEEFVENNIEI